MKARAVSTQALLFFKPALKLLLDPKLTLAWWILPHHGPAQGS
jgi:hypothetical protein